MKAKPGKSGLVALLPFLWLALFFAMPFVLVAKLSLSDAALAMPPYLPRVDWSQGLGGFIAFLRGLDLETYGRLTQDRLYLDAYLSSLRLAAMATGIAFLIGYPLAYGIARCPRSTRLALIMAVMLPFWTSFLIRIYAWIAILKPAGLLNLALAAVGAPTVSILNTEAAVILGLVYAYLPFMVLPIFTVLERQDESLVEAAEDLGASPMQAFWRITFPMSLPGAAAGALLCFIPMAGEFVIPDLMGGSETLMLGRVIWTEFFANRDWPAASAVAIVLLATLMMPILLLEREQARVR